MEVSFEIDYHTIWGESLYLTGNIPELGNNKLTDAIKMSFDGAGKWSATIYLPENICGFTYSYFVKKDSGDIRAEWGNPRLFDAYNGVKKYRLIDNWQDAPQDKALYSSAFKNAFCARKNKGRVLRVKGGSVLLKVNAPEIRPNQVLAVSGNCSELGDWDASKAVKLNDSDFPVWSIALELSNIDKQTSEYKFLILDKENNDVIAWESHDNRIFRQTSVANDEVIIISGLIFSSSLPKWRGAGTAIPIFSLRSDKDFGVGDFYDLKNLIDWAALTEQKIIQVLPVNDTTMAHRWTDSYPYNANSTMALHPMYLRPDAIGKLSDTIKECKYRALADELNNLPQIDYEKANELKRLYLLDLYNEYGSRTLRTAAYRKFVIENEYWLKPYSAYCVLRDKIGTPDTSLWGEYKDYDKAKVDKFCQSNKKDIGFIYFEQYFLDKQLREIHEYANAQGIALKGDIPIGISRTSVDAWVNPELFNMDCQAGAPPDDFAVLGQNWGFPTYNWKEMSKYGFMWWKNRLKQMSKYFDAYRIDHILGFFRIWQIPISSIHGLLGTFSPALPYDADEMKARFDFSFDKAMYTSPYITDESLRCICVDEKLAKYIKTKYLDYKGGGLYGLKSFVDNQQKVKSYFSQQSSCEENEKSEECLYKMLDDVLFIEDAEISYKYHPRISAQSTYVYKSLTDYQKTCFDSLYEEFYYHRHNDFWRSKGMWKLPKLIDSTDMLVCGEDLGMIPDCVPSVMNSLQILSLEVQRMPKAFGVEFGDTRSYPYCSVCTTSTHDMPGIRGWWEENEDRSQHYYNDVLHKDGIAPKVADPGICGEIVSLHLASPAMLAILPLQDWMSIDGTLRRENPTDEQINIPALPRHYWRYRMHITLEQLLNEQSFNQYVRDKISNSGRF